MELASISNYKLIYIKDETAHTYLDEASIVMQFPHNLCYNLHPLQRNVCQKVNLAVYNCIPGCGGVLAH